MCVLVRMFVHMCFRMRFRMWACVSGVWVQSAYALLSDDEKRAAHDRRAKRQAERQAEKMERMREKKVSSLPPPLSRSLPNT